VSGGGGPFDLYDPESGVGPPPEPLAAPPARRRRGGGRPAVAVLAFVLVTAGVLALRAAGGVRHADPLPPSPRHEALAPLAAFKPVTYTGRGPKTIRLQRPAPGAMLLAVQGGGGDEEFTVTSRSADGVEIATLVWARHAAFDGVVPLDFGEDIVGNAVALDVASRHPWTLRLLPVSTAPELGARGYRGHDMQVLHHTGDTVTYRVSGNDRAEQFGVFVGHDTVHWPSEPILEVEPVHDLLLTVHDGDYLYVFAAGGWTITPR
jgi:hypothetical protein